MPTGLLGGPLPTPDSLQARPGRAWTGGQPESRGAPGEVTRPQLGCDSAGPPKTPGPPAEPVSAACPLPPSRNGTLGGPALPSSATRLPQAVPSASPPPPPSSPPGHPRRPRPPSRSSGATWRPVCRRPRPPPAWASGLGCFWAALDRRPGPYWARLAEHRPGSPRSPGPGTRWGGARLLSLLEQPHPASGTGVVLVRSPIPRGRGNEKLINGRNRSWPGRRGPS